MHTFTTDRLTGTIEVAVVGFWNVEHVQSFKAELLQELQKMSQYVTAPKTLYNYTNAAIQSQDVVAAMTALAADPDLAGRRVAMYTDGLLARMQAKRVSSVRADMQVFTDRASAVRWLLRPAEVPTEPSPSPDRLTAVLAPFRVAIG